MSNDRNLGNSTLAKVFSVQKNSKRAKVAARRKKRRQQLKSEVSDFNRSSESSLTNDEVTHDIVYKNSTEMSVKDSNYYDSSLKFSRVDETSKIPMTAMSAYNVKGHKKGDYSEYEVVLNRGLGTT